MCRSVTLSLCPSVPLFLCHGVPVSLCHFVPLSLCPSVPLSLCPSVTLSLCHSVPLSLCSSVTVTICHGVPVSLCHFVPLSLCPSVPLSLCHCIAPLVLSSPTLCHSLFTAHSGRWTQGHLTAYTQSPPPVAPRDISRPAVPAEMCSCAAPLLCSGLRSRLVTILVANLVGVHALIEEHDVAIEAVLDRCTSAILSEVKRGRGTVVSFAGAVECRTRCVGPGRETCHRRQDSPSKNRGRGGSAHFP